MTIIINMNNMTHSRICILTVSNKYILFKPIIFYILHYNTAVNKFYTYGYFHLNIEINKKIFKTTL